VLGAGTIVVDSHIKKVQHPTGGVISELLVHDGQRVRAGDVVLRLDATQARGNLAIVSGNLDELRARKARLEAERDEAEVISFPADLLSRRREPNLERTLAGEGRFFQSRKFALDGKKKQLNQRIAQLQEEINGTRVQARAKAEEGAIVSHQLEGVRELWERKLIPLYRVAALERDVARLEGERGSLLARDAETKLRVTETNLQIIQVDQEFRTDVAKELADVRAKVTELQERELIAQDQVKRIDVIAPQSGVVHQLSVYTIGGVVAAGEVLMQIVPTADRLFVEARVAPQDVDQVSVGQEVTVRLSAFNLRTTPEITGTVLRISPDYVEDEASKTRYYIVRVELRSAELAKLGTLKLLPGMPAEAFFQAGSRTMISYLLKPIADQAKKAFKDE
jgi:HlyD family secretion protein